MVNTENTEQVKIYGTVNVKKRKFNNMEVLKWP